MRNVVLLIFLVAVVSLCSHAVELNGLYQAKIPVKDRSINEKERAIAEAFQTVLVKIGGQQSVLDARLVKAAIKQSQRYLTQFGFVSHENGTWLEATFDKERIQQLFVQAELPIWGRHRPLVMVWLVDEQQLDRHLTSDLTESPLPDMIKSTGDALGLPVILPIWDITDAESVSLSDIWGRFANPIQQASSRYAAEASVVIRISNSSLRPQQDETACQPLCQSFAYALDWRLFYNGIHDGELLQGMDKLSLIRTALNQVSAQLAQRYSVTLDNQQTSEAEVIISNLDSMAKYKQVSDLFASLSVVQRSQLLHVDADRYRFLLTLLSDKDALIGALRLEPRLRENVTNFSNASGEFSDVPEFSWK